MFRPIEVHRNTYIDAHSGRASIGQPYFVRRRTPTHKEHSTKQRHQHHRCSDHSHEQGHSPPRDRDGAEDGERRRYVRCVPERTTTLPCGRGKPRYRVVVEDETGSGSGSESGASSGSGGERCQRRHGREERREERRERGREAIQGCECGGRRRSKSNCHESRFEDCSHAEGHPRSRSPSRRDHHSHTHAEQDEAEAESLRVNSILRRCRAVEEELKTIKREGREIEERVRELEESAHKREQREKSRETREKEKKRRQCKERGRWSESDSEAESGHSHTSGCEKDRRTKREHEKELTKARRMREHVVETERALLRRLDELLEETRRSKVGSACRRDRHSSPESGYEYERSRHWRQPHRC